MSTTRRLNDVTPAEWTTSAIAAAPKPLTWSFSSLNLFETCPWKYKMLKVTKQAQDAPYDHRSEGNLVHKALENHLTGVAALPQSYQHLLPLVNRIKTTQGVIEAERKIALRADFTETTYFAKDVWMRAVLDVRIVQPKKTIVLDWKCGTRRLDSDQLKLFAAVEFSLNPRADEVQTGYVWLKEKKVDSQTFTRGQAPELWSEFVQRVTRIETAVKNDNFPKRPSGLCRRHCSVGRKLCEHCGES